MSQRVIFVAGASGAVGRTVVRISGAEGVALRAHYRKAPPAGAPAGAVIFSLDDREALLSAMNGATTVVQLIGTMRKRFGAGDTYETSDIGTTQRLVDAAKKVGSVDHVVLLSSVGAGSGWGAYLTAKAKAESIVTGSGLPYTIFRPSAFDGEGHHAPPGMGLLSHLPGLATIRPIEVDVLARTILRTAQTRQPLATILEGKSLFALADSAL